jgi:purine-binding chemotaxis protein CheW
VDILVFEVGKQRYGISTQDVQEIVRVVAITPLPNAPAIVEGVINLRGAVVPVLDVRARFGLPAKAPMPSDQLVIAYAGSRRVALRVDRALELISIDPAEVTPAHLLARRVQYLAGVARLPDGLLLIHDLNTFLSHAEAEKLDAASARGGRHADEVE